MCSSDLTHTHTETHTHTQRETHTHTERDTHTHKHTHTHRDRQSERERQIPYDITYMWNLKYDTNELIYKTERDSQTQRRDLWLPGVGLGGWERDGLGVWG